MSTRDFFTTTAALAEALAGLGVTAGDRVVLLSDNRPEWHQADLAILSLGAADVPVYPTLPAESVAYHVVDSGAKVAITENPGQTDKLLAGRDACPGLQSIIQIEGERPEGVLGFTELVSEHRGSEAEERIWQRAELVQADDLASIVYTSDTTGKPKGVMLSHRNFCANVEAVLPRVPISGADEALEFLPLCHVFERTCGYAYMKTAVTRTCCAPAVVADHIQEIAPTAFASVPRLYEKIHAKIAAKVATAPALRRSLFHWAVAVGREASTHRLEGRSPPFGLKGVLFIDNAVLIGDRRPYIVALLSPAEEEIMAWSAVRGLGGTELGELLKEQPVQQAFQQAVAEVNSDLGHFEQVKKHRILPRPFTLEDGYLTPTLKVKRKAVEKDFADLIEEMYG